mmetsp:Transcript_29341/g.33766  ORF Transcript_29341/g.33766 Transcript_29341/m.33766 type:complete len:360 (-) Transcript_29341:52-1131(-)
MSNSSAAAANKLIFRSPLMQQLATAAAVASSNGTSTSINDIATSVTTKDKQKRQRQELMMTMPLAFSSANIGVKSSREQPYTICTTRSRKLNISPTLAYSDENKKSYRNNQDKKSHSQHHRKEKNMSLVIKQGIDFVADNADTTMNTSSSNIPQAMVPYQLRHIDSQKFVQQVYNHFSLPHDDIKDHPPDSTASKCVSSNFLSLDIVSSKKKKKLPPRACIVATARSSENRIVEDRDSFSTNLESLQICSSKEIEHELDLKCVQKQPEKHIFEQVDKSLLKYEKKNFKRLPQSLNELESYGATYAAASLFRLYLKSESIATQWVSYSNIRCIPDVVTSLKSIIDLKDEKEELVGIVLII